MGFDLLDRIDEHEQGLTKILKKIAEYVRREYLRIPFLSIQEVSAECGVSATSIHRFCGALGYSGYAELQKEIQKIMQQDITSKETATYRSWGDADECVLRKQIDRNILVLQEMYTEDLNANFVKAARLIKDARRVYVLGLRESYCTAAYFAYLLTGYMDNVTLLTLGVDDIYDRIANVSETDVLFAIGFKAYTKYTVDILRYFQASGSTTICMTDVYTSPLAIHADVALVPGNKTPSYSNVMAMTIAKALSVEVLSLHKDQELDAISRKRQDLLKKKSIYCY